MKRAYADTSFGQIHLRRLAAREERAPPLVCLHPAPYSGLYFTTLAPKLNAGRTVIAPDYPGYGLSDAPQGRPTIADYAAAMLEVVGGAGPCDVLGFHTGCLVAAEMALQDPAAIRKLILVDIPLFPPAERPGLRDRMARGIALTAELDCLAAAWDFSVAKRSDVIGLDRAYALFIEQARPGGRAGDAFNAAFSYAPEDRFPEIARPVAVIATQSGLLAGTREAAALTPGAYLIERLDVTGAVMEAGADAIAEEAEAFLNAADAD